MNEQIRAEFEEWAKDKAHLDSFEVDGDKRYAALSANIMWEAWQAAHARYAGGGEFTWANFVSYLIDNCEGEAITEERLQHALSDMMTGVRYCPSMPTTHREADLKGVVVNNNLASDQILLAHPPHTTIPIGTVMIACPHPDVSHDCCVVCGKNIMPNKPDFEWLSASQEGAQNECD